MRMVKLSTPALLITFCQHQPKNTISVDVQKLICDTHRHEPPVISWRVTLCPRSIHLMVVLLCNFASVVEGHSPPTKSIATTVGWSILQHNQILPLHSHLPIYLGEVLHHQYPLAGTSPEDNHGYRPLFTPPRITLLTVFLLDLNKHSAHLINTRAVPITPLAHLATSRTQTTCTVYHHNSNPCIIIPPSSHLHEDTGLNNHIVSSRPVLANLS